MVDPASTLVMAVVNSAATALARGVVDQSYQKLREYVYERYGSEACVSLERLEQTPDSQADQQSLERALRNDGAQYDRKLSSLAQDVLSVIGNGLTGAPASRSANPAEGAFRSGGLNALSQVLQSHVDRLAAVRARQQIDDADLLTSRIASNRDLPEEVRRSANELHSQVRRIVQQVAGRIEDARYREVEAAVSELDTSLREREKAKQLVQVDKAMHVSYETLRLTVEFFGELNEKVLRRIEEDDASPSQLSNMMFGNAVIVYEITDFVIGYIKSFALTNDHEALHNEATQWAQKARREDEELERNVAEDNIDPDVRRFTLEDIRDRAAALDELDRQWDQYLEEIRKLHALVDDVKGRVPTLEVIRTNARNQITVLQATTMLRFLKRSSSSIRGAVETVQGLRLAPLSSERVRALVGVVEING